VFFGAEDYRLYRRLIATAARRSNTEIWAYCLMSNWQAGRYSVQNEIEPNSEM
jgi:hypothetical protein